MKALIVCCSIHHCNTGQIARAMALALGAEVIAPEAVKVYELHQYDCIGFGSGIYFGKHHRCLIDCVNKLPALNKKVFIFSTSGRGTIGWHHACLKKIMKRIGCEVIGEFSCRGLDTFGPLKLLGGLNKDHPTAKDLDDARAFARSLGSRVDTVVAGPGRTQ